MDKETKDEKNVESNVVTEYYNEIQNNFKENNLNYLNNENNLNILDKHENPNALNDSNELNKFKSNSNYVINRNLISLAAQKLTSNTQLNNLDLIDKDQLNLENQIDLINEFSTEEKKCNQSNLNEIVIFKKNDNLDYELDLLNTVENSELSSSSNELSYVKNQADLNQNKFNNLDEEFRGDFLNDESCLDKLKRLEEEEEHLNFSLFSLTNHFAQVQFRLKQIMDADMNKKESLLKELEEFAFRGVPDYRFPDVDLFFLNLNNLNNSKEKNQTDQTSIKLQKQREKLKKLILKLKEQLTNLEKYAYDTGDKNVVPSIILLERQNVIIEQLKVNLPLKIDPLDKMSPEDLRKQVDKAILELVNPMAMKEQLVNQLKTQVTDLERFIEFLQEGSICLKKNSGKSILDKKNLVCDCAAHQLTLNQKNINKFNPLMSLNKKPQCSKANFQQSSGEDNIENENAIKIIKKAISLLQMFTLLQFGCNKQVSKTKYERNALKKNNKINHWGDLRTRLEMSIDHLIELTKQKQLNDSDYTSEGEEVVYQQNNELITNTIRKQFCIFLRDLLEHGLITNLNASYSTDNQMAFNDYFLGWNCFSQKSSLINNSKEKKFTFWDILVNYFYIKKGKQFKQTPAHQLSISFNLDIVGGIPITPKQSLLSCIDEIIETHAKLKRNTDPQFKEFVIRALNDKKLVSWLKLIFKCKLIRKNFYESWSYINSNVFDEGLKSLDRLSQIKFNVPTDLAIRQSLNINEAF